MLKSKILKKKLRKESSIQYSGTINARNISLLKNPNYYTIDVPLDGDAPKEYIKAYFYSEGCPKKESPNKWPGFYAKFGGKSYPHESLTEYGINKIGDSLGLKMNDSKIVKVGDQIRFLSKDFIKPGKKKLIHGVEILFEYFEDKDFINEINEDKKQRREILTFDVIENAFKYVHPKQANQLIGDLVRLITFDAIVGNNDRHFYNWGVIGDIKTKYNKKVEFSPIYDTARGLLWNSTEEKVIEMYKRNRTDSKELEAFLLKAKPRFSFHGNAKANHFELVEYLINYKKEYKSIITELISTEKEKLVVLKLNCTIFRFFSEERNYLILKILKLRFEKLRSLI